MSDDRDRRIAELEERLARAHAALSRACFNAIYQQRSGGWPSFGCRLCTAPTAVGIDRIEHAADCPTVTLAALARYRTARDTTQGEPNG